jgi:hypothetical protein
MVGITKTDGAAAEFDPAASHRNIQPVRPGMGVVEVSEITGARMEEWPSFSGWRQGRGRATGFGEAHPVSEWASGL